MSELDLLERAQEEVGNDPLPNTLLSEDMGDDDWQTEFAAQSQRLVEMSRTSTAKLEDLIERVRVHPDNDFDETFSELGPLLSVRISKREDQIAQLVAVDINARRIKGAVGKRFRSSLAQVIMQLGREHRSLVNLYYLMKADADEVASDTHGGPVLASASAIDKFFDERLSTK